MKLDQLDLDSVEAVVDEKVEDKVTLPSLLSTLLQMSLLILVHRCHCGLFSMPKMNFR